MLLIFLCFTVLNAESLPFLDRLQQAKSGDYIVLEANNIVTLLAIRSINQKTLILEEISVPSRILQHKPVSWAAWVRGNAPGHTSWSMVEIDLKEQQILECYSFSRSAWIALSRQESLLATLLSLPLTPVQSQERRKIGPPPQEGETDRRAPWNPPLVYNGQKLESVLFDVYKTLWPQDGSELSGKTVSLYFDQASRSPLPYWIQVDTAHASASVRAIDSGKNLTSPFRTLPRRTPEFIGSPQRTKSGLRFALKSPKYYTDFELFAVDVTEKEKQIHPLDYSRLERNGEQVAIEVNIEHLEGVLSPGRKYTWLVVPVGYSESYTQTHKPFLWKE